MKWFDRVKTVEDHPGFVSAARKQRTITTEIQVQQFLISGTRMTGFETVKGKEQKIQSACI